MKEILVWVLSLHVLDWQLESKDDLYGDEYARCYR